MDKKYLLDKESLEKLAIEVFGEDRVWVVQGEREELNPDWDEDMEGEEDYYEPKYIPMTILDIYVHFPQLTITNSRGHTHPIKDLFVRFPIQDIRPDWGYKCKVLFQGMRTTYSLKEAYSKYIHSHLPSGEYHFNSFCTGSSEYNTLLYDISLNPIEENWLMLFMGLENFVSWESLEGGPYKKIIEIKGPNERLDENSFKKELKELLPLLPKSVWSYTDKLMLIENHSLVYHTFNQYSRIRKLNGMDEEEIKSLIETYTNDNSEVEFIWKEGQLDEHVFKFKIEYEFDEQENQIAREVVDKYIQIINQQVHEFNKNLSYEQAKQKYFPVTIAKAGIIL